MSVSLMVLAVADGSALSMAAAESTLLRARIEVEVHRLSTNIDEKKQGVYVRTAFTHPRSELARAIKAKRSAVTRLAKAEELLNAHRQLYSTKRAAIQAEQQQVDAWFTNKPRWKRGAALHEEAKLLDARSACPPNARLSDADQ